MLREDTALSRDERNANRIILENIQVMLLQQVNEINIDKSKLVNSKFTPSLMDPHNRDS